MCGIFTIIRNWDSSIHFDADRSIINRGFNKGQSRGPEHSVLSIINDNIMFGFHRLAINGLNSISNQPLINNRPSASIILILHTH